MIAVAGTASCDGDGGGSLEPQPPTLRVQVHTTGVDTVSNYRVRAGTTSAFVPVNGVVGLPLKAGAYEVRLENVSQNCRVVSAHPVQVAVVAGQLKTVEFRVECRARAGAIEVTMTASGRDYDQSLLVLVDAGTPSAMTATAFMVGSYTVDGVPPGDHEVTLGSVSDNCTSSPPAPVAVTVTAGGLTRDTSRIAFQFACRPTTGDVAIVTETTGAHLDPNGYTLKRDGTLLQGPNCYHYYYGYCVSEPRRLDLTGEFFDLRLGLGSHTYELGDIAANCAVQGSNPRAMTVVGGDTTEVRFVIVCTDIP
jgi:hypothetical protein